MRLVAILTLCFLCCAARAEFPPDNGDNDDDINSAIDANQDDTETDMDKNNPFSGNPDELNRDERRLTPRTNRLKKKKRKPARVQREEDEDPIDRDPDADEDPVNVSDEDVITPP